MSQVLEKAPGSLEALLLKSEVEQFLFREAALIDARDFDTWFELLHPSFRLYVPITQNVRYDMVAREQTRERQDMCWFDEGVETIRQRIDQIQTGLHWAEEPRSRTTHMLSNVVIEESRTMAEGELEVATSATFMIYRNRGQDETDFLVGRRNDRLRKKDSSWKLLRREVNLAQSVLLAKNLTTFF